MAGARPADPDPPFEPRVAAASLSGESDADWARGLEAYVGAAFLGGVCLDGASRAAAAAMVADRDREEFLPDDPLAFVDRELAALADADLRPGVNVRSTAPEPVGRAARVCARHGAVLEVNAHCRQAELCDVGCGEALLRDVDRLGEQVAAAAAAGATVSVKVRAEVPGVDLPAVAGALRAAGADLLHVDAMDTAPVVADVSAAAPGLFLVANNGVRDASSVREYLSLGADAVSLARPTDRPDVLAAVRAAAHAWFARGEREVRP